MSDINVTAHGINPETGEYLSPSERKALFKKRKMGSKINTDVFKSGVVSGVRAAQKVKQKAESDVGDFVDLERELNKLNDKAAGDGGKGGGISAIVPFSNISSGNSVKEPVEKVRVNVDDAPPEQAEESKESFKDALKKLLETLKKVTRIKSKQKKSSGKTKKVNEKGKTGKKKERKTSGRDIFGIGRKIKGKVSKTLGDVFGIFGDIIAFAALNWIADPKNKKIVKGIFEFLGHAFKFINFFVGAFVDNAMTGLSQLLGPDRSMGERFFGALRLITGFFLLRWIKKPWKVVKDIKRITKVFGKFSKFVNKIFKKPIQFIQNFVQKALNKTIGKVFKGALFKPLRRFIIQVGGKSLIKLLGAVGRGFVKIISRVPFIGALLEFFMDVFLFKKPPMRSGFKAIGAALLGAVGMIGGPIGSIIGGWVGGEAGGWLYDAWFGQGHNPDDPKDEDGKKKSEKDSESATPKMMSENEFYNTRVDADTDSNSYDLLLGADTYGEYTARFTSPGQQTATTMADGAINQQASLLLRNYEGLELNAYPDPATKAEPYTIGIGATYYPPGFRLAGRPGNKVELGDTITEAEAYEIKRYHVNQFASSAESKIGSGTWNKLPAGVKVALISKAFNYGEVYDSAIPLIESGADTGDFSDLAGYFSNRLAKHNNGINSWRRNDEASVILTNSSPRANLAFGGGSGMVRPKQSIAKLTKIPVRNSSMPSDSKSFAIDEKIKSNGAMELPIVINNVQENIARFSITTLTLNNNRMPVNQVLSRL